ncbi:bifunctional helix-turn-helix transcriptional regulator/GNAT family N-acetyltransferase [Pelagicoccus sp. SDUM812003]|uniref:bifunctional helix-turn-helix transcriptional regulator/GNAT family N-acetyltransferase n=1 Tax=Pelagicoccus sp. SDUM812003 TaxID=3041267 RepID=UPI00280C91A7|nr:bifunctional helix-turn-helix transcriptional regulator/GNAT family N-acetyltransferase [Pelagicoccus sp. SDUM812003]MDQ8204106.1 bifunctional helix-turn-helix transcriptional regulator/GNAT family N-acetyltransferase [Pelagicoccus sp. SDUM812003]
MEFYDQLGVCSLGSRLRRLGDRLAEDAAEVYRLYGSAIQPRWFPVYYVLKEGGSESVSAIAERVGQSHASVSQIAKEMEKAGFVSSEKGRRDTRKSFLSLTEKGRSHGPALQRQLTDVGKVAAELVAESDFDLWQAICDCERALSKRSLFQRVQEEKARRESESVEIVTYRRELADDFYRLNEEWITRYFTLEESDRRQLLNPEQSIVEKGGDILFALVDGECLGTCALVPHGEGCLEMAKMAVAPRARGFGLGKKLGLAAIERAKELGASRIYLESNRSLVPAISLYRKLGFVEVDGGPSPYARADIQMELRLDEKGAP